MKPSSIRVMKHIKQTAFAGALLCTIFVFGCGSTGLKTERALTGINRVTEDIDPFALGDEFALIGNSTVPLPQKKIIDTPIKKTPPITEPEPRAEKNSRTESTFRSSEMPPADSEIMGFRVQIGFFSQESDAQEFARKAESRIKDKVYIVYEAPFFRVRVGDYTKREEADDSVRYLKSIGYKRSWWIRTTINIQQ
ncbi:SPOR domain-containing protein [Candidatus Latescibacterota bacterium]